MRTPRKLIFFLADILFLNVAIWFSYRQALASEFSDLVYLAIYSNLSWLFLVLVSDPYAISGETLSRALRSQLLFLLIFVVVTSSLVVFFRRSYAPTQILSVYLIFVALHVLFRLAGAYLLRSGDQESLKNYLIVGRNDLALDVRKYYLLHPAEGMRFVGYVDSAGRIDEQVASLARGSSIQQVLCCVADVAPEEMKRLVDFGLNSMIAVKIILSSPAAADGGRVSLESSVTTPGMQVPVLALDEPFSQAVKRAFDMVFSLVVLVLVLSWLIPLISLIIRLDSRGPIFYLQLRNGQGNKPFKCIKFRTMTFRRNDEFQQATRDDQRITRVGKFLRKSSLDEFPQFINVLLGDMSVVGPRPHPIALNEQFAPLINNLMARHYAKPGITGLAQCMGYRGETKDLSDMANRVRLDRYYIENWSFFLDLKIILLTIFGLVRGSEKAY